MARAQGIFTTNQMKAACEAAARQRASLSGGVVREFTLVGEPTLIHDAFWRISVRALMADGTARTFQCESSDREVFAVLEIADT